MLWVIKPAYLGTKAYDHASLKRLTRLAGMISDETLEENGADFVNGVNAGDVVDAIRSLLRVT